MSRRLIVNLSQCHAILWTHCSPNAMRKRRLAKKIANGSMTIQLAASLSDEAVKSGGEVLVPPSDRNRKAAVASRCPSDALQTAGSHHRDESRRPLPTTFRGSRDVPADLRRPARSRGKYYPVLCMSGH